MAERRANEGFTLLELLIVISLIAALSYVLAAQLGFARGSDPRISARALGAELRYTSERAIATDATHRWVVDLDQQRYRIERVDESEPDAEKLTTTAELLDLRPPMPTYESLPIDSSAGEWHRLEGSEAIDVDQVRVGDEEFKKGTVAVSFASTGAADPAEIELESRETGERVRIQVLPFTSEVRVVESSGVPIKKR